MNAADLILYRGNNLVWTHLEDLREDFRMVFSQSLCTQVIQDDEMKFGVLKMQSGAAWSWSPALCIFIELRMVWCTSALPFGNLKSILSTIFQAAILGMASPPDSKFWWPEWKTILRLGLAPQKKGTASLQPSSQHWEYKEAQVGPGRGQGFDRSFHREEHIWWGAVNYLESSFRVRAASLGRRRWSSCRFQKDKFCLEI